MPWSKLQDMALSEEEQADFGMPSGVIRDDAGPQYPWGLRITLSDAEMSKLGLDTDCDVGDEVEMRILAEITSVSSSKKSDGTASSRVELQITKIALDNDDA